jgi:hypothetical protein
MTWLHHHLQIGSPEDDHDDHENGEDGLQTGDACALLHARVRLPN